MSCSASTAHRCVIFLPDTHICSNYSKALESEQSISKYTVLNFCTASVQALNFDRSLHHSLYPVEEADPISLLDIFSMFYSKLNATTSHSSTTVCRHLPQTKQQKSLGSQICVSAPAFFLLEEIGLSIFLSSRSRSCPLQGTKPLAVIKPDFLLTSLWSLPLFLSSNPNTRTKQNLNDSLSITCSIIHLFFQIMVIPSAEC